VCTGLYTFLYIIDMLLSQTRLKSSQSKMHVWAVKTTCIDYLKKCQCPCFVSRCV